MLKLKNITKDYPTGGEVVHALKGVSLSFRKSEFVSILGQSGCGKTTMLNIIGGLDKYTDGDLVINGRSTKDYKDRDWDAYRNHTIGFVFQSYNLIPHQTVIQNVELALALSGYSKAQRRAKAKKALEMVGLGDQLKKRPGEMSGGQMQRVAIARAIVNDPDIILADEPTGALDTDTSLQVMDILKELSKERLVIMVTHNPELAEKYSTRIVRMLDGLIVNDSHPLTEEELSAERAGESDNTAPGGIKAKKRRQKKPSLSPLTSFSLSLKNLFTKKGRTILTSFAGSIGIIGIALIISVSQGMTMYIDSVQESTLSAYPLTLQARSIDMTELMRALMGSESESVHEKDAVYKDPIIADMVNALADLETTNNDLKAFKAFIEAEMERSVEESEFKKAINGIQYTYNLTPTIYTKNTDGDIIKSDVQELMMEMLGDFMVKAGFVDGDSEGSLAMMGSSSSISSSLMLGSSGMNMWQELLPGLEKGDPINDMLEEQYDVVYGSWPNDKNEIVLVLNSNNELDDLTLYSLGLLSKADIDLIIDSAANGEALPEDNKKWSYEEVCGQTFKVIFPYDRYSESNGVFVDISKNESMLQILYENAMELKVTGIIRPSEDADVAMLSGSIGYTHLLTEHIIKEAANSAVVQAQLENPTVDVLTGLPYRSTTGMLTNEEKEAEFRSYIAELDAKSKVEAYITIQCVIAEQAQLEASVNGILSTMQDKDTIIAQISGTVAEQMGMSPEAISDMLADMTIDELKEMIRPGIEEMVREQIAAKVREGLAAIPDEQLAAMLDASVGGYTQEDCAIYYDRVIEFSDSTYEETLVKIGALDLDSPASINLYASSFENKDIIVAAIDSYNKSVPEEKQIAYTDFLGIMMSSITTIINAISYVLIAFVSVSLIVSSIMIGVITLISVQERTKEIGILRALGASKANVSGMFNAETLIIGFSSGMLGVIVTYLLIIPINLILNSVTGISNLDAVLPIGAAVFLVVISMVLTLFSGIIPSRSAAKKDPVVALRTE